MSKITESMIAGLVPYTRTLGMRFPVIGPDLVVARLEVSRELSTIGGALHGGAILSLADAAAAVLATVVRDDDAMPATTESSAHFLEPVRGNATARAVPLRVSRSAVVVQVEVFDSTDARCAIVTQTVARIPAPKRQADPDQR